jgi:hypothetical protein
MYKGKPIKITADFSTGALKTRRAWSEVLGGVRCFGHSMKIISALGYSTPQNHH